MIHPLAPDSTRWPRRSTTGWPRRVRAPISVATIGMLIGLLGLGGCGGSGPDPSSPNGGTGGTPSARAGEAGASPGGDHLAPLAKADCVRLVDHILAVASAEQRAALPPEALPTEADIAKIRATMLAESEANCVGQPRGPFDCAIDKTTTDAIRVCLSAPATAP